MAISSTPTRLCAPTALTGSEATLYTAPTGSGLEAVIRNIHVCNTAEADRALTLAIGATGTAANQLYDGLVIPASDALDIDCYIGMNSAETLRAFSSSSGGLTITVMGLE